MNSTAVKPPVAPTKLCHLIKRPDFEGYGFNLHSEKIKPGQFIGKIDVNSPAEAAGLKKGDRIIEVNGVPINNETHKQVVQRIKALENEVRLMLIDVEGNSNAAPAADDDDNNMKKQQQQQENINSIINNAQVVVSELMEQKQNKMKLEQENDNANNDDNVVDNNKISNDDVLPTPESMQSNFKNSSNSKNVSKDTNQQIMTMTSETTTTTNVHDNYNNNNNENNKIRQNEMPLNNNNNNNNNNNTKTINGNHSNKTTSTSTTGTLQLPFTAAEMRAKLMSKKKYDPKTESVDIKKKFQIIQTL